MARPRKNPLPVALDEKEAAINASGKRMNGSPLATARWVSNCCVLRTTA